MRKGYLVVEGHGEDGAMPNLVSRLSIDLGLSSFVWGPKPTRWQKLTTSQGAAAMCELMRPKHDCGAMLVLKDEEDGCPRTTGPLLASWLRDARLPFPAAVVLLHREYETLFLASLASLAGKPLVDPRGTSREGVRADATFDGDPQAKRDAKGVVSSFMPPGRVYKPTVDQLALTRQIEFALVRASGLPCFGTLERALGFLDTASGGDVYPCPPPHSG